ncbi:MAG TPA: radical SAM protein, partial [Bacteroidales bacterium]|nr:radical SAM protein [Bacteroidales bacterium]
CYYLCKYCTTPAFLNNSNTKKKWSGRSVDNIVIEMEQLVKEDQIRQVIFCDDNFINKGKSSREKGNKLADSIIQKELKLKFWIMTRVDCYDKNDDDFVLHLKRAGLWGIFLGLETGSTKVIEDLNKRTTIEKNIETARLFKRNNIMIEVGFINFYPTSTTQDLLDNLELLYQLNEANYFNYFSNKLQLYPGIHLIHELRKKGLLVENYNYKKTDGYKFEHPEVFELYKTVKFVASKLRSHDLIIWNYKRLYQITVELVNFKENNESNTVLTNLISARDAIYSCLSEVNTINYNFMLKYLDTNLNKSSKSNLMNAHLEAVNIAIDKTIVPLVSLFEIKDYLLPSLDKTFLEEFFKSSLYQRIDEKEYCYG